MLGELGFSMQEGWRRRRKSPSVRERGVQWRVPVMAKPLRERVSDAGVRRPLANHVMGKPCWEREVGQKECTRICARQRRRCGGNSGRRGGRRARGHRRTR